MSGNNKEDRKRQPNQFAVEIIRVDGTRETAAVDEGNWLKEIEELIGADCLDSVDLRDGRTMFVDDLGYSKGLSHNTEATPSTTRSASLEQRTESKGTWLSAEMRISPEPTWVGQRMMHHINGDTFPVDLVRIVPSSCHSGPICTILHT
jgi:hypothetical protein